MATYRIGIGTEFKLDGGVGIGTDTVSGGLGDLRVDGTTKTTDLDVTGVSTFTRYAGFSADNIEIDQDRDLSLTGEHGSIGDIVVGVNSTFTVSTGATVDVGTVPTVTVAPVDTVNVLFNPTTISPCVLCSPVRLKSSL